MVQQPALCFLRFSFAVFAVKIYHKKHKYLRKARCLYIQLILLIGRNISMFMRLTSSESLHLTLIRLLKPLFFIVSNMIWTLPALKSQKH
ncbi:MAG: hypothetical protein EAY66_02785 [Sphingobacteriales bacterium]|nr:MAG: hypothetical protein EAY66_02785 [Sphingobacteriales bacterium]